MLSFIVRRFLASIAVLYIVASLAFVMIRLAPGDPVEVRLGIYASEQAVQAMRKELGLDRPLFIQYLDFLKGLVVGDFGESLINRKSVAAEIGHVLPYTLELTVTGIFLGSVLGIPIGVYTALYRNSLPDYLGRVFSLAGLSFPSFYLGILLIWLFSIKLHLFPVVGGGDFHHLVDNLHHLFLPALTLGLIMMSYVSRVSRSSVLNVLQEDYVRTARAKGLSEGIVIYKHALRNALLSVVSLIGLYSVVQLGGSLMVEVVFSRPGLGKVLVGALKARDYTVLQSVVVVYAAFVVLFNLLTDLAIGVIDPRVKYD